MHLCLSCLLQMTFKQEDLPENNESSCNFFSECHIDWSIGFPTGRLIRRAKQGFPAVGG
jgi:hypothetical protein